MTDPLLPDLIKTPTVPPRGRVRMQESSNRTTTNNSAHNRLKSRDRRKASARRAAEKDSTLKGGGGADGCGVQTPGDRRCVIALVIDVVSEELVTWISDLVVISGSIPATIKFIELD